MSSGTQWKIVIGVVVAVIVIGAAFYANRNRERIDREALALFGEAKAAFGPQSNVDDVRKWLQERDWIISTNDRGDWVSGYYRKDAGPFDPPEYLIVRAYRQLGRDDNMPGHRWISLHFRFKADQTFQSVYLDRFAPPPPGWRPPATAP